MLESLKPSEVFHYFEELCHIPHGSGNTKHISDYIADFAKKNGLSYVQDEWNNLIIFKPATAGYEQAEPIILQGHMDMVCEKEEGCPIQFESDGLSLQTDGEWIWADQTTLGADDGIAVAYCMALLADHTHPHPALEVLLTVDEETGMDGAANVDLSMLRGKKLLNIDSEEEGHILCGCAGGMRCDCTFSYHPVTGYGTRLVLSVEGLFGGHSGAEIHKGRANANQLIGRLLDAICTKHSVLLLALEGGSKDNAIPRNASAVLLVNSSELSDIVTLCRQMEDIFQKEYAAVDPALIISCVKEEERMCTGVGGEDAARFARFLIAVPNGVQNMHPDMPGLVETSLNLGIMKLEQEAFAVKFSLRSSALTKREALARKIQILCEQFEGSYTEHSSYPGWEYKRESAFRELLTDTYEDLFGSRPVVEVIHAGLECGLLSQKIEDLDCVSIGPDMQDIHTPKERLSVASTERVWQFILEVLKRSN